MARPGLLLYFDILPALDKLPHEAVGELLLKALHYAQDGNEPTFEGSDLSFAWAFLKPSIDRDGATYNEKRQRGDWLTYCRQCKRDGVDALDFETWREHTDNGTLHTVDVALPATSTTPSPSSSTSPTPAQEHIQPINGTAAVPPAPARDSRNLIFLSDEQYKSLLDDMGETELLRCIDYLSEYSAMSGKTYRDWSAAIQKCHREQWGVTTPKGAQPGADFRPSSDRIKQHNAWIDSFLEEQKKQQEGAKRFENLPGVIVL